jgi:hypothetical protein
MINSLWIDRRSIIRVSVPLSGPVRHATFRLCRMAENASAFVRRRLRPPVSEEGVENE